MTKRNKKGGADHSPMPTDVRKFVLLEQAKIKIEKGVGQFSIELTIHKLLRDYEKILNEKR